MKEKIIKKLQILEPISLEVIDESHKHFGHAGYKDGGESHFRIKISSNHFNGKTKLEKHRMINNLLEEELKNGIHALVLEIC